MRFKFDKKDKQLSQKQSDRLMKRPPGTKKPSSAESIARLADTGKDVEGLSDWVGKLSQVLTYSAAEACESRNWRLADVAVL